MIATNHALAGLIIGEYIHNPALAFGAGVLSHIVLDEIPHFDFDRFLKKKWQFNFAIGVDLVLFGILIIIFLPKMTLTPSIIAGVLGALSLDLIDNVPFWQNWMRETKFGKIIRSIHEGIHHTPPYHLWYVALFIELSTTVGLIFWVIELLRF